MCACVFACVRVQVCECLSVYVCVSLLCLCVCMCARVRVLMYVGAYVCMSIFEVRNLDNHIFVDDQY